MIALMARAKEKAIYLRLKRIMKLLEEGKNAGEAQTFINCVVESHRKQEDIRHILDNIVHNNKVG